MNEEKNMTGTEDSFISHLIELRSRLMKASLVVIVIFLLSLIHI